MYRERGIQSSQIIKTMFKQSGNKISQKPCVRVLLQQEKSIVQTVSQKSLKNS